MRNARSTCRVAPSPVDPRRRFGNTGEALAAAYLMEKGFVILEAQVRTSFGEIDLIAQQGEEVVFVEVKTRAAESHGFPEESITRTKWRHMCQAAETYLTEHKLEHRPFRIDVVAIRTKGAAETEIVHFEAVDGPYGG